jgi:hypothetical protein
MKSNPLLRIIEVMVLGGIAIAFFDPLFTSEAESAAPSSKPTYISATIQRSSIGM